MRIMYYFTHMDVGGAEKLIVDYLINLKNKGNEVQLVVIRRVDSFLEQMLTNNGIKIVTLFGNYNTKPRCFFHRLNVVSRVYFFSWVKIIREFNPDIIHLHSPYYIDVIPFPRERMIYTIHTDVDLFLQEIGKRREKTLQKFANSGMIFAAISEKQRCDIRTHWGVDNVTWIPNGVRLNEIRISQYKREAVLKKLGIPNDGFIVGNIARFDPIKNHEKMFEIFSLINRYNRNSYFFVIGDGDERNHKRIESLIDKYKLKNNVVLFGMIEDASRYFECMDTFVLLSKAEGFSLVTIEAQACNVRSIITSAVPDEVICNENCIKLDINLPSKDWAEMILDNNITNNNRKDIDIFDIHSVVCRLEEEYRKVIK